jgi:hypothetical protein
MVIHEVCSSVRGSSHEMILEPARRAG